MSKINSILLIDDNQFANYMNKNLIQDLQITNEIKIVHNGSEAIKYLEGCNDYCFYPDLILLDLIMPLVDGFQFMEYLRMLDFLNKKRPIIIALTAVGDELSINRIKSLEVNEVLFKPLDKEKLLKAVNRYFPHTNMGVTSQVFSGDF
ncbi:MAG TPA: response regulator [Cytophagaceae bacterium]|jgi:CheY-like chemotaxis protein